MSNHRRREQLVIRGQQRLVHGAALHVRARRSQAKILLAAIKQSLRLTQGLCAIEQDQRTAVIVSVLEIHQAFVAAIDQPARRRHLRIVTDPVAAFACRLLVAGGERKQSLQFADAQFLPPRADRNGEAENFPQRPFVIQVRCLQIGEQFFRFGIA